jgi:hypothetical protein
VLILRPILKRGQKKLFFKFIENSLLNNFIHFQLQNNAIICLQIPSKVKVTVGKSCCFLPSTTDKPNDMEVAYLAMFS